MKREFLKGLGLESDVIDKIMEANGADIEREKSGVEAKNGQIEELKTKVKNLELKASDSEKEFGDYKTQIEKGKETDAPFKEKYDTEVAAHNQTKTDMQKKYDEYVEGITKEKTNTLVRGAVIAHLKSKGANAAALDKPLFQEMLNTKIDATKAKIKDDKVENLDELTTPLVEGLDFMFGSSSVQGVNTAKPPMNETEETDAFLKGFNYDSKTQ